MRLINLFVLNAAWQLKMMILFAKIDYGNLNDYIKITWHDGRDKWSYGLHFKYKRQPDHLIVQDNDGFELDFYATSLSSALNIRDKKTIKNY